MKRLFKLFSVSILLIFASCTGSKHLPTQQNNAIAEFKMASYNIRCDVQADVKSGNAWDLRKKPLTDLIINHHFDMVGVQEPYGNQI